jgi:hypothetical protein
LTCFGKELTILILLDKGANVYSADENGLLSSNNKTLTKFVAEK